MESTVLPMPSTSALQDTNPFKGAQSYDKSDRDSFHGRDKDLNELMRNVEQYTLSLLYSRSGVGKTSLVKAGLIPVLEEIKKFFPVYIRISDNLITQEIASFSEAVVKLIKDAAQVRSIRIDSDEKMMPGTSITNFLYFSKFYSKENNPVIPVLIFDQFEELFSLRFDKSSPASLLDDLKNPVESLIPAAITDLLSKDPDGEDKLLLLKDELQSTTKWYRVLFSFREEYLPSFDSLKNIIPSVFYTSGRYHLEAFSVDTAADVILKISSQKIQPKIAVHLSRMMSRAEENTVRFKDEVQPFILSLICSSIYPKITGEHPDDSYITAIISEDQKLIRTEINNYVEKVFNNFRPGTKRFIEEELITEDGNRTMKPLSDSSINDQLREELVSLSEKQEYRFLNVVVYFGAKHIEILHDRFLPPLLDTRKERRKKEKAEELKRIRTEEVRKRNKRIFIIAGIFTIISSAVIYFLYQENQKVRTYNRFFEERNTQQLALLRENVQSNSIGALMNILEYEESVTNLPVYKNKSTGIFRKFNDSIYNIFQNEGLVFVQKPEEFSTISNNGTFIFYSHALSDSSETIIISKLDTIGYQPFDSILFIHSSRNQSKSELALPYTGEGVEYFDVNTLYTSPNDSLLIISRDKKVFVYELYNKSDSKYKMPIDSLSLPTALFSHDSRFLINGDDNNEKNFRIYKIDQRNNKSELHEIPLNQKALLSGSDFSFIYIEDRKQLASLLKPFGDPDKSPRSYSPGEVLSKFSDKSMFYSVLYDVNTKKSVLSVYDLDSQKIRHEQFDSSIMTGYDVLKFKFLQPDRFLLAKYDGMMYTISYPQLSILDSFNLQKIINDTLSAEELFVVNKDLLLAKVYDQLILINIHTRQEISRIKIDAENNTWFSNYVVNAIPDATNKTITIINDRGELFLWHYTLKPKSFEDLKNYNDSLFKKAFASRLKKANKKNQLSNSNATINRF